MKLSRNILEKQIKCQYCPSILNFIFNISKNSYQNKVATHLKYWQVYAIAPQENGQRPHIKWRTHWLLSFLPYNDPFYRVFVKLKNPMCISENMSMPFPCHIKNILFSAYLCFPSRIPTLRPSTTFIIDNFLFSFRSLWYFVYFAYFFIHFIIVHPLQKVSYAIHMRSHASTRSKWLWCWCAWKDVLKVYVLAKKEWILRLSKVLQKVRM